MSATTDLTLHGQKNLSGDELDLFIDVARSEIMAQFETATVTKDKQLTQTIDHGKSASFPVMGSGGTAYYSQGQNILDPSNSLQSQIPVSEQVINIDKPLLSSTNLAEIDSLHAHYSLRAPVTNELGLQLAYQLDRNSLQTGVLAARSSSVVTGGPDGSVLNTVANVKTDGSALAAQIFAAAEKMDEKNVPEANRFAFVRPAQYYKLVRDTTNLNTDWGGRGSYADGMVLDIAGIKIIKTNHLPITNIAAVTGQRNTYSGDFSDTAALVMHPSAIGTVFLQNITFEAEWKVEYQAWILVAKYASGTGILRPEAAIEIAEPAG